MTQPTRTPAEEADHHRTRTAQAALSLAAFQSLTAAQQLATPETAKILDWIAIPLALLAVGLVLPILRWKLRNRDQTILQLYRAQDGYLAKSLTKAHIASWGALFVTLTLCTTLDRRLAELPPAFLIHSLLALLLGVFALTFLWVSRDTAEETA